VNARSPRTSNRHWRRWSKKNLTRLYLTRIIKPHATEVISRINEFHPNLLKRVVIIIDEDGDSQIKDLAERYSIPHVQRKFLVQQLWGSLEASFRPEACFRTSRTWPASSLIASATRFQLGCEACMIESRRLLYAAGSLRVDLLIEVEAGSNRLALVGKFWIQQARS